MNVESIEDSQFRNRWGIHDTPIYKSQNLFDFNKIDNDLVCNCAIQIMITILILYIFQPSFLKEKKRILFTRVLLVSVLVSILTILIPYIFKEGK